MNVIRSRNHEPFSETVSKGALSCDDDKKFILEDGIGALARGHWRIKEREEKVKEEIKKTGE